MTSLNSMLARKLLNKKGKKQNGFTLIELMVVVAIVGILTAVGLPQLTKAQDEAKDAAAKASLSSAAKECSLSLILNGDDTDYNSVAAAGAKAGSGWATEGVSGDCALNETLTGTSTTGNTFSVKLTGSTPGPVL